MSISGVVLHEVPGFRFYPTEEELIEFFLHNKLENKKEEEMERVIPVVHVYCYDPWQLPGISSMARKHDEEWIYFCPRQESEAPGGRTKRTTPSGYWKATGSPSHIISSTTNRALGVKNTMVFYQGKTCNGRKTKWKMNEYKAFDQEFGATIPTIKNTENPKVRGEYSICRVYTRSGCIRLFDRRPSALDAELAAQQLPRSAPAAEQPIPAMAKRTRFDNLDGNNGENTSAGTLCQQGNENKNENYEVKLIINEDEYWHFSDCYED